MNKGGSRLFALLLFFMLGVASFYAITWGLADIYAQRGYDEMAKWDHETPTNSSWLRAYEDIEKAHKLDSSHPAYLQRIARLHRIQITAQLVPKANIHEVGSLAKSYLARSIEVRPRWGFTWAELAYLKWLMNERDELFFQAIKNATKFGPWEPQVVTMISFLGVAEYGRLERTNRQVIVGNLVNGLRSPVSGLFENTFASIEQNQEIRTAIVSDLYPYLGERPWSTSVRFNFFKLADWAWDEFNDEQQSKVVDRVIAVTGKLRTPHKWINNAMNTGFRGALCDAAVIERPEDRNVKVWCDFSG